MNSISPYHLEISADVSKESLMIFDGNTTYEVKNQARSIAAWLGRLRRKGQEFRITCEATGGYENKLLHSCLRCHIPVSRVNPTLIKHFIRSLGRQAKTDAIDARMIHRYASERHPSLVSTSWLEHEVLQDLHRRAEQLKKMSTELKGSLDKYSDARIRRQMKGDLVRLSKQIQALYARMDEVIASHSRLQSKREELEKVVSIGPKTSAVLLVHLPELGSMNRNQVASLAGLAPFQNQSGSQDGKRFIRGGRKQVRTAMFLAAITAIRHNAVSREIYLRHREGGKPARVALIAVARKLLVHLNSLLKPYWEEGAEFRKEKTEENLSHRSNSQEGQRVVLREQKNWLP